MLDAITIDQLRMLIAIADEGSFTAAAKSLKRAQSAVSHAISNLEAQLQVQLFDRTKRKPCFTPVGEAVVADARLAVARIDSLKARAQGLAQGLEPEISLVVTTLCPKELLLSVLGRFHEQFPFVGLELLVEEIGESAALVQQRRCVLGISGTPSLALVDPADLVTYAIGDVEIVAVAAPDHPLAAQARPLFESDIAEHRQLVPTSRTRRPYHHTLVREIWCVSHPSLRRDMVLKRMGWGTLPLPLVEEDIAAGRLVRLSLASRTEELMRVGLFAVHRADVPTGPAARWLLQAFRTMFL
jgi:DNA-binding transcriptional LysR family regulator